MVITEQMENAVDQQEPEFVFKGNLRRRCVARGPLGRDHHVAQQQGLDARTLPFLHRKGDHIGRPVTLEKIPIQRLNGGVVENQDGQLCVRLPANVQNPAGDFAQWPFADLLFALAVFYLDSHVWF